MPRKAFMADLQLASDKKAHGIQTVARGENDEDINILFAPPSGLPIEIGLLVVPDVSTYPSEHSFMIFTTSSDGPQGISAALESIQNDSPGLRLPDLITSISQTLTSAFARGSRDDPLTLEEDSDVQMVDEDEDESEEYEYDDFDQDNRADSTAFTSATYKLAPEKASNLNKRIRNDLRAAKFAGYSIGILSGMKAESVNSLLSLSIRASKLGLSEEAIQAWDLEPQQYIVLLIRYSCGYKTFNAVTSEATKSLDVSFRIGISNRYKPTTLQALAAFTDATKDGNKSPDNDLIDDPSSEPAKDPAGFFNMFISSSLNEFINSRFIDLLKIRNSIGLGWDGAKKYHRDRQGRLASEAEQLPADYFKDETCKKNPIPKSIASDHLQDYEHDKLSFPLIAIQFAVLNLVRCTDFCLVCHDNIEESFEALKPYVCTKPLCLYQYMSLGFGPSVEHEILTQPYVVDLLVSFCYASAYNQKLREYPTGMSLAVPAVTIAVTSAYASMHGHQPVAVPVAGTLLAKAHVDVKYDAQRHEIVFNSSGSPCPINIGEWLIISNAGRDNHYRVEDTSLFPTVKLSDKPVQRRGNVAQQYQSGQGQGHQPAVSVPFTPATTPPLTVLIPAKMTMYNENFDTMDDRCKAETIVMLLETLPSIKEMETYLVQQSKYAEPNLKSWKDRVSPAALGILRWIIASNRSCIVQVDRCPGQEDVDVLAKKIRLEQRISNITEGWVQFRFAQGSPDKEQRFLNALKDQQANLNPQYPTIFAFHGSPLPNWHSIIRTGLDFKETLHGRAYGHGIYHALDQNTSVGYAQPNNSTWHGSTLQISSAMSVNEIVNCPSQFASSSPYLVVQHVDWVQCRYLFVQVATSITSNTANRNAPSHGSNPSIEVMQDPNHVARSTLNKAIGVPLCAVSTSRAFRVNTDDTPKSKRRKSPLKQLSGGDAVSDGESISDIDFLFSDDEGTSQTPQDKRKSTMIVLNSQVLNKPMTDFVPGSLDQDTLPMLAEPGYGTPGASKSLSRALKEILAVQKKTPLHELGWYIDECLISNLYQWIVELHSFDPELPLAKDMKATKMTSIVIEVRYGKDFPFTPPFVRVIRPRFLPFTMGGGGHVTAGGAMCMELLTNSGWSSVSSIESVLMQVRMAIMNLEPRPARLENSQARLKDQRDYGTAEAVDAYIRACRAHGWQVPPDFMAFGQVIAANGSGSKIL